MKQKVKIVGAISVIIILITAIGLCLYNKNTVYTITVTESFCDVYGNQYHNEEIKKNIKLNDTITVNGGLEDELTFKVIKISTGSVTLRSSENMSQMKNNSVLIDDEFVINTGEKTVLNRLVTDMGVSYKIKAERQVQKGHKYADNILTY